VEEKMVYQGLSVFYAHRGFRLRRMSARFGSVALVSLAALLLGCAEPGQKSSTAASGTAATALATNAYPEPPEVPREFRAAWVATVANIDWPSKRDLTTAQQQAEIIAILDRAQDLRLNAIVLQVRTVADALYASPIEPWSEFLTGTQGKAPEPYYDPLQMWVAEAHKRGIELHAWFNPYRARHTASRSPNAPSHIANTKPFAVKQYGGFLWMDPGESAAAQQTLDVILDVVRRYDIDGVHIDDYFYPYPVPMPGTETPPASPDDTPVPRAELPFPDQPSWSRYLASGGKLSREDWRRQNVNELVERIYNGIKREKPHVKFGISPFGIGKPDRRPPGIAGFSQYDKLFADAELWLNRGWLDYFTPQLYWPIDQKPQAYGVLLDYWARENTRARHLWPGIYTSRINDTEKSWQPKEIVDQVALTRVKGASDLQISGHVHFSMVALLQNRRGIADAMRRSYANAALVPASPWLSGQAPAAPKVRLARVGDTVRATVNASPADGAFTHVVWAKTGGQWVPTFYPILGTGAEVTVQTAVWPMNGLPDAVRWSWVDRYGNESARIAISNADLRNAKVER
jgi:uncharacterized lipoprotein YddW (UPF0748 family)